jgi:hypothetical protein
VAPRPVLDEQLRVEGTRRAFAGIRFAVIAQQTGRVPGRRSAAVRDRVQPRTPRCRARRRRVTSRRETNCEREQDPDEWRRARQVAVYPTGVRSTLPTNNCTAGHGPCFG